MLADATGDRVFEIAMVYAFRGQADQAFEWLERARVAHVRELNDVKGSPFLRSIRGDPRYAALLKKMNLPLD